MPGSWPGMLPGSPNLVARVHPELVTQGYALLIARFRELLSERSRPHDGVEAPDAPTTAESQPPVERRLVTAQMPLSPVRAGWPMVVSTSAPVARSATRKVSSPTSLARGLSQPSSTSA